MEHVAVFVLRGAKALDSRAMPEVGAPRAIANDKTLMPVAEFVRDAAHPTGDEDEDDVELPDFVVGDDDEDSAADQFDEDIPALRDDGGDPLDDANAADLDIGVHIDETETRDASADANDEMLDVGASDDDLARLENESSALDDDRETGGFVEDDEFSGFDKESSADDGGTEGTGEDAANDVDESALPELDESEHDHADDSLADELLAEATRARLPAWAARRFVLFDEAGAPVPCMAVAVAGGRVFAAGDVVLRIDEGAHAAAPVGLEGPCLAVAATEGLTVIATTRDGLFVSRDALVSASTVTGFRSAKGPVGLACTPSRIWLVHERTLWSMSGDDKALVRVRENGVWATSATQGVLVALSADAEGVCIEKLRGDDEAWLSTRLPEEVSKFVIQEHALSFVAAAAGKRLAIGSPRGLYLSNDGGQSFSRVEVPSVSALCFASDDDDGDLLVLVNSSDEPVAYLIRVTEDGEPARLAEVRGTNDSGSFGDATIAWDTSRELVWIASRNGLAGWGLARRH